MVRTASIVFAVATVAGCGNSDRMPTYETTGSVQYEDGEPIEEGTVMLVAPGLPPGRALIEKGRFEIGTYEESDGAVEGTFQIAVLVAPPVDYDPDAGRPPAGAKAKYERPETSGLEFQVTADGKNELDLVLEREK